MWFLTHLCGEVALSGLRPLCQAVVAAQSHVQCAPGPDGAPGGAATAQHSESETPDLVERPVSITMFLPLERKAIA